MQGGVGRIGVDLNVPISSCAFVATCVMSPVFAPLAEAPTQKHCDMSCIKEDAFLPETRSLWELDATL